MLPLLAGVVLMSADDRHAEFARHWSPARGAEDVEAHQDDGALVLQRVGSSEQWVSCERPADLDGSR